MECLVFDDPLSFFHEGVVVKVFRNGFSFAVFGFSSFSSVAAECAIFQEIGSLQMIPIGLQKGTKEKTVTDDQHFRSEPKNSD